MTDPISKPEAATAGPLHLAASIDAKRDAQALQEDLVEALSALFRARDILRGISDHLIRKRAETSWQQQMAVTAGMSAATVDEQAALLLQALRGFRPV